MDVIKKLAALEKRANKILPGVPGTTLSRVLMDMKLAEKEDPRAPKHSNGESVLMWCLALGPMSEPKVFFYSITVDGVILKAEKDLRGSEKAIKETLKLSRKTRK